MMGSVGKGSLLLAVFPPHLSCLRIGLGPGTHPYQDIKTPHGHKRAGLISLHGNIFPCFGFSVFSTVLLKHVQYMAPGQPCCNSCSCRERLLLLQHKRQACKPVALHRLSEGNCWPWGTNAHSSTDLALSLPYIQSSACLRHAFLDDSNQDAVGKSVFELLLLIK